MATTCLDNFPFIHLENTNLPPGQTECAVLNSRMSYIDVEIGSLDKDIARMVQKRELLQEERKRCGRLLSPLRRLPNEILLEVFTDLLYDDETSVYRVSQVCRSWRQLVIGAPLLWTEIVLPGPLGDVSFEEMWRHLSLHVNRTKGRPMSLTIDELPEDSFDLLVGTIFGSVIAHWASISLHATKLDHMQRILAYFEEYPAEADHLSSVAFTSGEVYIQPGEFADTENIVDFTVLSALRSLRMDMTSFITVEDNFYFDWEALTSLSLGSISSSQDYLEFVLSQCPNLEDLTITPDDDEEDEEGDDSMLTLNHLRTLTIVSDTQPSVLLRRLSAPSLKELTLQFPAPLDIDDVSTHRFLRRSTGRLRSLSTTGEVLSHILDMDVMIDNEDAVHALRNITSLHVVGPYRTQDQSYRFDCSNVFDNIDDYSFHFSKLRIIEVHGHEPLSDVHASSLFQLLESCSTRGESVGSGPALQRFVLTEAMEEDVHPMDSEGLTNYRKMGILIDRRALTSRQKSGWSTLIGQDI